MGIEYNFIEDGTKLTASTLTSRFNSIANGINALDADDIDIAAYNLNHLPSCIIFKDTIILDTINNVTATAAPSGAYYQGFGVNAGWTPLTNGTSDLMLNFGKTIYLDDDSHVDGARGILLLCDVQLQKVVDVSGSAADFYRLHLAFQYKNGLNWHLIPHSERYGFGYYDSGNVKPVLLPMTLRTLITLNSISHSSLTAVRVCASIGWTTAPTGTLTAYLSNGSLSALAFRSKLL